MKRNLFICTFVLSTLLLSGCSQSSESTVPSESTTPSESTVPSESTIPSASAETAPSTSQAPSSTAQNGGNVGNKLSEDEAKKIALTHAGLTAEQVTFIKSGLDRDNGRENYDIEFYTQDYKEYDYKIDPYTGDVLDYDYDAEYYMSSSNTTEAEKLTEDNAKQIALAQVEGATLDDIREFKSDYDNGKLVYEGKIYFEQKEYEFEIDGQSGAVMKWDVETIYGGVMD